LLFAQAARRSDFPGDPDEIGAAGEFQQALKITPNLASSHYGLGLAYYQMTNYPSSIREFQRALAIDPALTDAQTKLQLAYKKVSPPQISKVEVN